MPSPRPNRDRRDRKGSVDVVVRIYGLSDERDPARVLYIGQTCNALRHRLAQHVSVARAGRQSPVAKWIRTVLAEGRRPVILQLATAWSRASAERAELRAIGAGADLLNVSQSGYGPTLAHRRAIGAALRGRRLPWLTRWRMSHARREAAFGWMRRRDYNPVAVTA